LLLTAIASHSGHGHNLLFVQCRAVKSKRDYLGKGSHYSWLYLSRLAALKEFAFMKTLKEHGLPVPQVSRLAPPRSTSQLANKEISCHVQAIDHNRHALLMNLLDARPLVQARSARTGMSFHTGSPAEPLVLQIRQLRDPRKVYEGLMELISRLAGLGLVHCDFNEFNLLASTATVLSSALRRK
jgi:RIO kinase 2